MRKPFRPLRLELLEDRVVPAAVLLTDLWGGTACDAEKMSEAINTRKPGGWWDGLAQQDLQSPDRPTNDLNHDDMVWLASLDDDHLQSLLQSFYGLNDDTLMCWAAAASNVLEWTGWGRAGGLVHCDDIFQHFRDHWLNTGGKPNHGLEWWFKGDDLTDEDYRDNVLGGGGFFPEEDYRDYFRELFPTSTDPSQHSEIMDTVANLVKQGYGITLRLRDMGPDHGVHWVTCWGYEYSMPLQDGSRLDPLLGPWSSPRVTFNYDGIYVTDSDDHEGELSPPDTRPYYPIQLIDGRWRLTNYRGTSTWCIVAVQALAQRPQELDLRPDLFDQAINFIISPVPSEYAQDPQAISPQERNHVDSLDANNFTSINPVTINQMMSAEGKVHKYSIRVGVNLSLVPEPAREQSKIVPGDSSPNPSEPLVPDESSLKREEVLPRPVEEMSDLVFTQWEARSMKLF